VLVHRRQLLDQWVQRLSTFLEVPAKSIGRIGGGRHKPTGLIDVAVIQSLVRKGVVGVDGALHLADPEAYRRDRRKDQLLQENGYLVLRFLAEDLGKELDSVLDSILRSLTSRQTATASVEPLQVLRRR
jgi:superfamily II DNA or RNA helicase